MKNDEIERIDFTNWPLPDQYLSELGRIAALWTSLEAQLDVCLGKLAGFDDLQDPRPFIVLKHSSFPQKLDMLGALCEHLAPEFLNLAAHSAVIGRLRAAQRSRNRFMHNGMSLNPATQAVEVAVGSARGKLKAAVEPVAIADLKRVSVEIHEAMLELHKLVTGREIEPRWQRRDA